MPTTITDTAQHVYINPIYIYYVFNVTSYICDMYTIHEVLRYTKIIIMKLISCSIFVGFTTCELFHKRANNLIFVMFTNFNVLNLDFVYLTTRDNKYVTIL